MTAARTVTLTTADRGDVTLPDPAWCSGHTHHDPLTLAADLVHSGPETSLTFRNTELFAAGLVQHPRAAIDATPELGSRATGVTVYPLGETLGPITLYELAAALDGYADRLRDLADQLAALTRDSA
ncbi:hypothetical protein [Streptomyces sp. NPDC052192]|uniref:DUF6907 domain-containing protein n=1 Tax=Streptomyces sp. NPDC052192 TaxID=3155052 RepID=UPI0034136941